MSASLNGSFTGQQKLQAIQAKGYYKDVPDYDKSDGAHQYEIALKYDQMVASGDIIEAPIPARTGVAGFSDTPANADVATPIPNVAPTTAQAAGTNEYD